MSHRFKESLKIIILLGLWPSCKNVIIFIISPFHYLSLYVSLNTYWLPHFLMHFTEAWHRTFTHSYYMDYISSLQTGRSISIVTWVPDEESWWWKKVIALTHHLSDSMRKPIFCLVLWENFTKNTHFMVGLTNCLASIS